MSEHDSDLVIVEAFEQACVARFLKDVLLDPIEVERIGRQLGAALESRDPPRMVVVLDSVTQISSLMLSVLLALRAEAEPRGGSISLAAIPERVDYLLKLLSLRKAFAIFDTVDDALANLA